MKTFGQILRNSLRPTTGSVYAPCRQRFFMTNWKSLRILALISALFAATHTTQASHSEQVISSNGTTNIVERIDFPVGDIKDIIPAGDKYIIHAKPIDSLKGGVAVDALFVMEKDKTTCAFGRTFTKEIHSVAYVPDLDFAVWSYKDTQGEDWDFNNSLLKIRTGESSLQSAGSICHFIEDPDEDNTSEIQSSADLFASGSRVYDMRVSGSLLRHEFLQDEQNNYIEKYIGGKGNLSSSPRAYASDSYGVFVAREGMNRLSHYRFISGAKQFTNISNLTFPLSMAKMSTEENDGAILLGYEDGHIESREYTDSAIGTPSSVQIWNEKPIISMSGMTNQTVNVVSDNTNELANVNASLNVLDRMTPNSSETGYRKVIADNDTTLLLSIIHSNYFYRIKKVS